MAIAVPAAWAQMNPRPLWTFNNSDPIGEPVFADDGLRVLWSGNKLYCVHAATGELLWHHDGFFSAVAVGEVGGRSVAFVTSIEHGFVRAVHPKSGQALWTTAPGIAVASRWAPTVCQSSGVLAVLGADNELIGVSMRLGNIVWNAALNIDNTTRVSNCGSQFYVAMSNETAAVDAHAGTVQWQFAVMGVMWSIVGIKTAAGDAECAVAVFEALTPIQFHFNFPQTSAIGLNAQSGAMLFNYTDWDYSWASPAAAQPGVFLIGADRGNVHRFMTTFLLVVDVTNTSNVNMSTSFGMSGMPSYSPALDLYVLGTYTNVSAISFGYGELGLYPIYNWTVQTYGYVDHPPTVSEESSIVAVRDDAGYVYGMLLTAAPPPTTQCPADDAGR